MTGLGSTSSATVGTREVGEDETLSYSIPWLPEDIWCHIHSLMPMRDAARAACLSRAFLRSWRCRPNLTLNCRTLQERTISSPTCLEELVGRIIRNHSGIGLKTLKLDLGGEDSDFEELIEIAESEDLTLVLYEVFNFPCSLLSVGVRNSIQDIQLESCIFRPTSELGPFRRLASLDLSSVRITGDELECLLSNSLSLEKLELFGCDEIIFLRIPCVSQQLSRLTVLHCYGLQVIECKAPSLSIIVFSGENIKLSLAQPLQIKELYMGHPSVVCYARAELPSIMPNLETLVIDSCEEVINTPMLLTKFLYLKHLTIEIWGRTFSPSSDYFSLVSFLDASPSLETLTLFLDLPQVDMEHQSVFGGSSHLRQLPEHRHNCLKIVEIIGFSSAKSLVELTCCIVKNTVSLECLTLDTLRDSEERCYGKANQICWPISNAVLKEASRTVLAIRMYIEDKIAPTTKLTVLEPCTRCHFSG